MSKNPIKVERVKIRDSIIKASSKRHTGLKIDDLELFFYDAFVKGDLQSEREISEFIRLEMESPLLKYDVDLFVKSLNKMLPINHNLQDEAFDE